MDMDVAVALISDLHEQLACERTRNEDLTRQNQALVERIGELEQKIAALEALKTPPPPWAKYGGRHGWPNTHTGIP